MNKIWLYLILLSSLVLVFTAPDTLLGSMLGSARSVVTLSLEFCGIYAVWLGLLEILDASGLSEKLSRLLTPLVKKLFKTDNPEAIKQISISLSANMLGLGNAATPSGIKAMRLLDDKSKKLNYSMLMFMVISSCSIQLLPATVIALRQNAGSANAYDIILPTLLATLAATGFAVFCVFLYGKFKHKRKGKL